MKKRHYKHALLPKYLRKMHDSKTTCQHVLLFRCDCNGDLMGSRKTT